MKECRPGDRLLAENGAHLSPGTLSAVRIKDGKFWGITAGHVLRRFGHGQRIWYFPAGRELLGQYVAPCVLNDAADLAKLEVPEELVMLEPQGFPSPPELFPEHELTALKDKDVIFLGGQIGRVPGRVTAVGAQLNFASTVTVRLSCTDLREGNSGGPLYIERQDSLLWIGTLVAGRALQPGFSEGVFVHPGAGLAELGLS